MSNKEIIIYSKVCLACEMDDYCKMVDEIKAAGYSVVFLRTPLRPEWHEEASRIRGAEDYIPFARFSNGSTIPVACLWKLMTTFDTAKSLNIIGGK